MFDKKTMKELEKERDELKVKAEEKMEFDKVKDEIKELKGKSSSFNKEKVLNGWKGMGKGFGKGLVNVLTAVGKGTTRFAERTQELEKNSQEAKAKAAKTTKTAKAEKGKTPSPISDFTGFEPGKISIDEAFGMGKPKGGKKDGYIF